MKTICIYHSRDLDGWMSAAIVNKAVKHHVLVDLNTGNEGGKMIGNPDKLYMLGWDYGDEIPDLSEYDEVIMCDISFPKEVMKEITHDVGTNNFIWIDHHKSAIEDVMSWYDIDEPEMEGLRDTKFAACELTWKYFFPNEKMPEIVRLLGRYDCFGHKGTDEEQKVLEFQYGARQCIGNYEEAYKWLVNSIDNKYNTGRDTGFGNEEVIIEETILEKGESIYQYLCSEATQVYKKAFSILLEEPDTFGKGVNYVARFLCVNQERFNPINFGINYHKDGFNVNTGKGYDGFACFWYKDGKWSFSLYNDNGEVDCSEIAKGYGGGGHAGASGFVCDNETMLKII